MQQPVAPVLQKLATQLLVAVAAVLLASCQHPEEEARLSWLPLAAEAVEPSARRQEEPTRQDDLETALLHSAFEAY